MYQLPLGLSNYLRLRIFGSKEIFGKCQVRIKGQCTVQAPFQKQPYDTGAQEICNNRYQIFPLLSNFA